MTGKIRKVLISLGGFILVLSIFSLFNGYLPTSSKNTYPACEKLPKLQEVEAAYKTHENSFKEIESLGRTIQVRIDQPCKDYPDRGLILVTYGDKKEEKEISNYLSKSEGFGVPVYVKKHK